MQWISRNPNVVELTDQEVLASARFEELLDAGHSCVEAARLLLAQYPFAGRAFLDYLVGA